MPGTTNKRSYSISIIDLRGKEWRGRRSAFRKRSYSSFDEYRNDLKKIEALECAEIEEKTHATVLLQAPKEED